MSFQLHNGMGSAFFTTSAWGPGSSSSGAGAGNSAKSRPGTSSGERDSSSSTPAAAQTQQPQPPQQKGTSRERKSSFGRKPSFTSPKVIKRSRSSSASGDPHGHRSHHIRTDSSTPPAIPDFALAAAAKASRETDAVAVASPTFAAAPSDPFAKGVATPKRTGRSAFTMNGHYSAATSPPTVQTGPGNPGESSSFSVHQHIHELANKRIATLDYLRKAHEGRIYWFNTLLFDKSDPARMPYFNSQRLARRATNYLLLGLSLPTVIDLHSSAPLEFLRALNLLLAEFESYQQIHTENGTNTSTLSRAARLPSMFRRGPGGRGRRQSGAGEGGLGLDGSGGPQSANHNLAEFMNGGSAGGGAGNNNGYPDGSAASGSVINFGLGAEGGDLLPGEEYAHLLTPNLPFDPDFSETFAALCDALIDCYTRLMALVPTARDCGPGVAELFSKADAKVRKLIVQGVVKEFEDAARAGLKREVAGVGTVVLSGLM